MTIRNGPPAVQTPPGLVVTLLAVVTSVAVASVLFLTVESWFIHRGRTKTYTPKEPGPPSPPPEQTPAPRGLIAPGSVVDSSAVGNSPAV